MSYKSCFVLYILALSESTSWLEILSIIDLYVYFRLDGRLKTSSAICEPTPSVKSTTFSYQGLLDSSGLYKL
nr:MAG TPA: hypothetical protein [Caudoviricetes sp.]